MLQLVVSWVHYTTSCNKQSGAPEDGRDQRPKHVQLIGIINKPLLLHLVGVYIIYINDAQSNKYKTYIGCGHMNVKYANYMQNISRKMIFN